MNSEVLYVVWGVCSVGKGEVSRKDIKGNSDGKCSAGVWEKWTSIKGNVLVWVCSGWDLTVWKGSWRTAESLDKWSSLRCLSVLLTDG